MSIEEIRKRHEEIDMCLSVDEPMSDNFILIHQDRGELLKRVEELEATLERVRALPDKWREQGKQLSSAQGLCVHPLNGCADELEAALKGKGEG